MSPTRAFRFLGADGFEENGFFYGLLQTFLIWLAMDSYGYISVFIFLQLDHSLCVYCNRKQLKTETACNNNYTHISLVTNLYIYRHVYPNTSLNANIIFMVDITTMLMI